MPTARARLRRSLLRVAEGGLDWLHGGPNLTPTWLQANVKMGPCPTPPPDLLCVPLFFCVMFALTCAIAVRAPVGAVLCGPLFVRLCAGPCVCGVVRAAAFAPSEMSFL